MLVKLPKCSFGGYIGTHDWTGFAIGSTSIREWVSSYALALDAHSLCRLGYRIEHRELLAGISNDNLSHSISTSYPISDPLRDHIIKWLSEGWYNAKPIHMWDPARLKLKFACILNEMLLSASCQENSIGIIDFQDSYIRFKAQFAYLISIIEQVRKIIRLYPKVRYDN
jgi:hypothetical protein